MQNIIRFARKYRIPMKSSFGLPECRNLNHPEVKSKSDPATATTWYIAIFIATLLSSSLYLLICIPAIGGRRRIHQHISYGNAGKFQARYRKALTETIVI
jgi:hypothetical protein